MKRFGTALLCFCLSLFSLPGCAQSLGPAHTAQELRDLAALAEDGDTVLLQGTIDMGGAPLFSGAEITLASAGRHNATIVGLRLRDVSVTLRNLTLRDSLITEGECDLTLSDGVEISGTVNREGLSFNGSGVLIVEPGCTIQGGSGASGVTISQIGGELYAGLEGTIRGGDGVVGGSGVIVSPLEKDGVLLLDGDIRGGSGQRIGGNALNLYGLRENAYVSVTGTAAGGEGPVGGDGVQIVSLGGNSCIGISGRVSGGEGDEYGGNALLLMDAGGSSTVGLSGQLTGGNSRLSDSEPGRSLLVADSVSIGHAVIGDCMLQEGSLATAEPTTVLPEITSSIDTVAVLDPTPMPPEATPYEAPAATEDPDEAHSEDLIPHDFVPDEEPEPEADEPEDEPDAPAAEEPEDDSTQDDADEAPEPEDGTPAEPLQAPASGTPEPPEPQQPDTPDIESEPLAEPTPTPTPTPSPTPVPETAAAEEAAGV